MGMRRLFSWSREGRGMSGTDSTEYAEFCGDSLLESHRAQLLHRNDGVVSVLREVDPVGTVHSGLVGDVVAAIHDRGFGVVLRVESSKESVHLSRAGSD